MKLDKEEIVKSKPVQITVKKDEKDNYVVPEEYKEIKRTANGYLSYYNIFDNRKGFNYVPTARLKDSKGKIYKGVQGMAHFAYDYDFTSEQAAEGSDTKKFLNQNVQYVSGVPKIINKSANDEANAIHKNIGSTVKDYYYTIYHKNPDGTVNIKYKKENEFEKGDKVGDPLRQYRFTDIDWNGPGGDAESFKGTVRSLHTKKGNPTFFIFDGQYGEKGKDHYGKFSGLSVVFIVQGTPVAMDFSGSINQIKEQGEQLIKQFNIKPEDLIVAYHDLGSYSGKPDDINNEIDVSRYYEYNTNKETGAGLAIPVKKKHGGWINKYQDGTSNVQINKYDPVVKAYLEQSLGNNDKVLITDRGTNTTYYGSMDPNGKWNINQFEVLTGAGGFDPYNNVQPWKFPLSDREQDKDLKVTAVGSYPLQYMDDMYGMPGYALIDPYEGVNGFNAYHTTYVGEDDPNRAALYANNNNEDNYRSYGCINCQKPNMQNLIDFIGKDPKGMQSLIIDSRLSPKENDELIKMNTPWSNTTAYMEQVPVKVRTSKKYGGWLNKYKNGGLTKYKSGTTSTKPTLTFTTRPVGAVNVGATADNTSVVINTPKGPVVTGAKTNVVANPEITKKVKQAQALQKMQQNVNFQKDKQGNIIKDSQGNPIIAPAAGTTTSVMDNAGEAAVANVINSVQGVGDVTNEVYAGIANMGNIPVYTNGESYEDSYNNARKTGSSKFIWKNPSTGSIEVHDTKSDLSEEEQLKKYGITDSQIEYFRLNPISKEAGKRLRNNIYPFSYGEGVEGALKKVWNGLILNQPSLNSDPWYKDMTSDQVKKQLDEDALSEKSVRNRLDAVRLYTGAPQLYNTFSISKYKNDAIEKEKGPQTYYSINMSPNEMSNMVFQLYGATPQYPLPSFLKTAPFGPNAANASSLDVYLGTGTYPLNKNLQMVDRQGEIGIMNKYTAKKGKDDKGEYFTYYDNWDLDPVHLEDMTGLTPPQPGKPFYIYDKVYVKNYGTKEEPRYGKIYFNDNELKNIDFNKVNYEELAAELINRNYLPSNYNTKEFNPNNIDVNNIIKSAYDVWASDQKHKHGGWLNKYK